MTAGWPVDTLDVATLRASGWEPTPFRQFVLKVTSRCNLDCDYCYMYHAADRGWRSLPRVVSTEVVHQTAARIAEHARAHRLDRVNLILHGGEPVLVGGERLAEIVGIVRGALPPHTALAACVQTNGTLLDESTLEQFVRADIRVGVSLDGDAAGQDRHRRDARGNGSYAATAAAVRLLTRTEYRRHFLGLLTVIDLQNDPVNTYEALAAFNPPAIDFLLPHATWSNPPRGAGYGRWLAQVFDRWYDVTRAETRVRLFGEIIQLILGGMSHSDQVGLSPAAVVVVNVNGDIEQIDTLRVAGAHAQSTAMTVDRHDFDTVLMHPAIAARQIGAKALCETCQDCPLSRVCGAGHYSHRYRPGSGFRNPSVYCDDLAYLIRHIGARVCRDLAR